MSLRIRLTLIIASLMTLLVVADSVRRLYDAHDDAVAEMESVARLAHALLPSALSPPPVGVTAEALLASIQLTRELSSLRHLTVEVRAASGQLILSSRSGPQQSAPFALGWMGERLRSRSPLRKDIRVGQQVIGYYWLVPYADDELREIWDDYIKQTSMVAAIGLIACLMVFWAVGRALHPLGSVMRALSAIGEGRLDARLENVGPGDLAPLSESFNSMASTLEAAVDERARLLRKLITHEEEIRHALARDLHDELSPYLVAIHPHARLLADACDGRPELAEHRESAHWMSEQVGHMLRLVRNLLEHLRPPDIEELGLGHALRELGKQRSRCADAAQVSFDLHEDLGQLSAMHDITLYRIVQECMTNTVKHARCTRIDIRLDIDPGAGRVSLRVRDDGEPRPHATPDSGFGLVGMRERALALGGDCRAGPRPEGGWQVDAWLPLKTSLQEKT
ncbi:ATP-binding protein [Methyloversatilis sp.]|uniref:sensor histidine kinase n=1 Tax=Methyloversatilis sp. TaxID=2569862 RepID=UPI002735E591|nr:ATP-binding protein [Methyloversatilis sp.]MDP2867483.1 histidine kinase [Methyloversatilis sp.]MDP3455630.1 histidine kinase [Methyloversatilis sp.]MDP3577491.1 histidine kinase [Methyloversatilis sp.]